MEIEEVMSFVKYADMDSLETDILEMGGNWDLISLSVGLINGFVKFKL